MDTFGSVLFAGKRGFLFGVALLALALALAVGGAAAADGGGFAPLGAVAQAQGLASWAAPASHGGELSAVESEGLLYMREEEKLARDVYLALYDQWGLNILENIARSEQRHMDAVLNLMDAYGLDDPAAGNAQGEFANAELQALYDELVERGSVSLDEALRVGAAVEEIDILDLREYAAQTEKQDLLQVYDNLSRGSNNHLRAFASTLERQTGEEYQPQVLSQEAYDEIVGGQTRVGGWRRGARP